MGAVLAQVQDGQERAICYVSKALSEAQTRYSATKRELLAVVNFTQHFRHYLLGTQFNIVTDHSALQWLHNFKDPDALTARWLAKLAAFNYEVAHRTGKSIGHAEGLSRMPTRALTEQSRHNRDLLNSRKVGRELKTNPNGQTDKNINHIEKEGDLVETDDSIAHYLS